MFQYLVIILCDRTAYYSNDHMKLAVSLYSYNTTKPFQLNKVAQAIENELVEAEVTNNLNNVRLSSNESELNGNNQTNDNVATHQNGDILVCI